YKAIDDIRAKVSPLGSQAFRLYQQATLSASNGRAARLPRPNLTDSRVRELANALSGTIPLRSAERRQRIAERLAKGAIVLGSGIEGVVALIRAESHGALIEAVEQDLDPGAGESIGDLRLILQEIRDEWLPTRSQRRVVAEAIARLAAPLRPEELWR